MKMNLNNPKSKKQIPWKIVLLSIVSVIVLVGIIIGTTYLVQNHKSKRSFLTLKFEDSHQKYDGKPKTIEVTGLISDAEVEYFPTNTYTEPGTYTITAKVSKENYNDVTLSATLYIEKYYVVTFHQYIDNTMADLNDEVEVKQGDTLLTTDFPQIVPYPGLKISWAQTKDIENVQQNMDVYTTYDILSYTLNLYYADGTINTIYFDFENLPIALENDTTKDTGIFFGWYTDSTFEEEDTKITEITAVRNYNLYSYVVEESEGIQYHYYQDYVEVTGYQGENPRLVIPKSKFNMGITLPVTRIATNAFYQNDIIEEVYLLSNEVTIMDYAFRFCYNLNYIKFYGSVANMGDHVFANNYSLNTIEMASGTKFIGTYCFSWASSLRTIVLPNTMVQISEYAFNMCNSLTNIYYNGTKEQFEQIKCLNEEQGNNMFLKAKVSFYSEEKPEDFEKSYWHYVDGQAMEWEME